MKKTNDEIIKNVIENGRLYPRPKDKCDICNDEIVLCWGNIRLPYWRHLTNTHIDHSPNCESFNHKFAKNILINYLNDNNNKCNFIHTCNNIIINIPNGAIIFKPEIKYKNCIFDIGGFDENNKLVFGIEIYHTHKTENIKTRNDIDWVEVKAYDVINVLDRENVNNTIQIKDYSEKKCCGEQLKNLSFKQIGKKLGYFKEGMSVDKETRNILIVLNGYYETFEQWLSGVTCDCNDEDCDDCNNEKKNKNNKSYMAMKKTLWNEFLSRKKCMCCEKKYDTKYYKPYCLKCYKKEQNDELCETNRIHVSNIERDDMKKYLIERNKKIESNIYDFIDDKKYVCFSNGECLFLSFDENNNVITYKNPNFECEHDCKLCKGFINNRCYCKARSEYLETHDGFCMNCDMDDFKNKKGAYNDIKRNNTIEI